jgi:hypothetical protein
MELLKKSEMPEKTQKMSEKQKNRPSASVHRWERRYNDYMGGCGL